MGAAVQSQALDLGSVQRKALLDARNSGWAGTLTLLAECSRDLLLSSPTQGAWRQVLLKLLENAEISTPEGGQGDAENPARTPVWVQVVNRTPAWNPEGKKQ